VTIDYLLLMVQFFYQILCNRSTASYLIQRSGLERPQHCGSYRRWYYRGH